MASRSGCWSARTSAPKPTLSPSRCMFARLGRAGGGGSVPGSCWRPSPPPPGPRIVTGVIWWWSGHVMPRPATPCAFGPSSAAKDASQALPKPRSLAAFQAGSDRQDPRGCRRHASRAGSGTVRLHAGRPLPPARRGAVSEGSIPLPMHPCLCALPCNRHAAILQKLRGPAPAAFFRCRHGVPGGRTSVPARAQPHTQFLGCDTASISSASGVPCSGWWS